MPELDIVLAMTGANLRVGLSSRRTAGTLDGWPDIFASATMRSYRKILSAFEAYKAEQGSNNVTPLDNVQPKH